MKPLQVRCGQTSNAASTVRAHRISLSKTANPAVPKPTGFVNHLLDLLRPLGEIRARSMFGGWGFYHAEKMFALVALDTFYVKADDLSRGEFESQRLQPFTYEAGGGRRTVISYYTVPSGALESPDMLCEWARKGIEAAARATAGKRNGKLKAQGSKLKRSSNFKAPRHHRQTGA
jgi:DNA transformation protein